MVDVHKRWCRFARETDRAYAIASTRVFATFVNSKNLVRELAPWDSNILYAPHRCSQSKSNEIHSLAGCLYSSLVFFFFLFSHSANFSAQILLQTETRRVGYDMVVCRIDFNCRFGMPSPDFYYFANCIRFDFRILWTLIVWFKVVFN